MPHWIPLSSSAQLNEAIEYSKNLANSGVLLFKHSTRCSISSMAKNRLDRNWPNTESLRAYYLDLINFRNISNEITALFDIQHESPQLLLIKNGQCVYHASHNDIAIPDLLEQL